MASGSSGQIADVIGVEAELVDGLTGPFFIRNPGEISRPGECVKRWESDLLRTDVMLMVSPDRRGFLHHDCFPASCQRNSRYVTQIAHAIPAGP